MPCLSSVICLVLPSSERISGKLQWKSRGKRDSGEWICFPSKTAGKFVSRVWLRNFCVFQVDKSYEVGNSRWRNICSLLASIFEDYQFCLASSSQAVSICPGNLRGLLFSQFTSTFHSIPVLCKQKPLLIDVLFLPCIQDKVANFWCSLSVIVKLKNLLETKQLISLWWVTFRKTRKLNLNFWWWQTSSNCRKLTLLFVAECTVQGKSASLRMCAISVWWQQWWQCFLPRCILFWDRPWKTSNMLW